MSAFQIYPYICEKDGLCRPFLNIFAGISIPALGEGLFLRAIALLELNAIEIIDLTRRICPAPIIHAVRNIHSNQRSKDDNSGHIQHSF